MCSAHSCGCRWPEALAQALSWVLPGAGMGAGGGGDAL